MDRPRLVQGDAAPDPRVEAVLAVLGGDPAVEVARRSSVDVAVLHRWVRAFVDAGSAQVTNTPVADAAAHRDRFLAAFAHETRTPLTTAQGWVALLAEGDVPPAMMARTVEKLDAALHRLAERSRDVELLATASLGRLRAKVETVALADLAEALTPAPPTYAGAPVSLAVDPELMRLVLRDLWAAAHLTPDPHSVALEVGEVGPWQELRVVRTGPPIPPTQLQLLFEPFDANDDATGITIGLYLARALAVAHGGSIGVEQDEDRTEFWVHVPRQVGTVTATT